MGLFRRYCDGALNHGHALEMVQPENTKVNFQVVVIHWPFGRTKCALLFTQLVELGGLAVCYERSLSFISVFIRCERNHV